MDKPSLALVGPWPRPWGGISTHIFRLFPRLKEKGFRVSVYDDTGNHTGEGIFPLRGRWINRFVFRAREGIIHYHSHGWGTRMRLSLMGLRGKRVIFTVHSMRNPPNVSLIRKPEFRYMMAKAWFIAVNEEIARGLSEMGARNVEIIGPYISPPDWGIPHPIIRDFVSSHHPVLCTSALLFKSWNRTDLYGLLSTLEALSLLREELPKAGLIIYLSQIGEERLFGLFKERMRELGLENDVVIRLNAEEPFYTCLPLSQVFLRPTFSDSFGLSMAEALELGVPVVASDAVPRPKGVIPFRAGDPRDMALAIKRALGVKPEKLNLDSLQDILDFYAQLVERGFPADL
ncbi:MAG: glycosyltransferase family 4 protein [candidate division WOR-3 bacterium]